MKLEPSLTSGNKGSIQTSLIPSRSGRVEEAWQRACELGNSKNCTDAHLFASAYALKAAALSFFNSLAYLGMAVVSLATKGICRCDFSDFGKDIGDAGKSLGLSFVGLAFFIAGLFCPKTVFSKKSHLEKEIQQKPQLLIENKRPQESSKTPEIERQPPSDERKEAVQTQKTEKKPKEAPPCKESTQKLDAKEDITKTSSVKRTTPPVVFRQAATLQQSANTEDVKNEEKAKGNDEKSAGSLSPEKKSAKADAPEKSSANKESSVDDASLAYALFMADVEDAKSRQPSFQDPMTRLRDKDPILSSSNHGDYMTDAEIERQFGAAESKKDSRPRREEKSVHPMSLQPSEDDSKAASRLPFDEKGQSCLSAEDLDIFSKHSFANDQKDNKSEPSQEDRVIHVEGKRAWRSHMSDHEEAGNTDSSKFVKLAEVLPGRIWSLVQQYAAANEGEKIASILRLEGPSKESKRHVEREHLKNHFIREGIQIQFLDEPHQETEANRSRIKVFFKYLQSEGGRHSRDYGDPTIIRTIQTLMTEIQSMKSKGLLTKEIEYVFSSVDASCSDLSLAPLVTTNANFTKGIEELNLSCSRITIETFGDLHQMTNLKSLQLNFVHSASAPLDRYSRPGQRMTRTHESDSKSETKGQAGIVTQIGRSQPCPSVKEISLIGIVMTDEWFSTLTKIFPNATSIYYTTSGENFRHIMNLKTGELLSQAEYQKEVDARKLGSRDVMEIGPAIHAKRVNGRWKVEESVEYGAVVHKDCGVLFNPSLLLAMYDLSVAEAVRVGLECPHCSKEEAPKKFSPSTVTVIKSRN